MRTMLYGGGQVYRTNTSRMFKGVDAEEAEMLTGR